MARRPGTSRREPGLWGAASEQNCTGSFRSLFPLFALSRFVTKGISRRVDPRRTLVAAGDVLDALLDIGVAGLAWWALLYAAMCRGLPLDRATALWFGGIAVLAALRSRGRWYPETVRAPSPWQTAGALALTAATSLLASVVVRGEWDDASYVVRTTWVAEHGAPAFRDMIFSNGIWPATPSQEWYVASIETLLGALAHVTGAVPGDVVYEYTVVIATGAAVWASWLLLRAWGARRPLLSLFLTLLFLVMGGFATKSFGNFYLARIWQGKVMFVAVLMPYLYAVLAALSSLRWTGGPRVRAAGAGTLLGVGSAAIALSTTAVFVLPLAAAAGLLPLLARRGRRVDAILFLTATSVGPLIGGVATLLAPHGGGRVFAASSQWLWSDVLGGNLPPREGGLVAVAVVLSAALVAMGLALPRWFATTERTAQYIALSSVVVGLLVSFPPLYPILTSVMGGDEVAYRLAWIVPVPILVGLVASLPALRRGMPAVATSALVVTCLVAGGVPLWSSTNSAHLAPPGAWKVRSPDDLAAAQWIVSMNPTGPYLAPNWVTFATGALTSRLHAVGTRSDYMLALEGVAEAHLKDRLLLQRIVDKGIRNPTATPDALRALKELKVTVMCVLWNDAMTADLAARAGYVKGFSRGPWTCFRKG